MFGCFAPVSSGFGTRAGNISQTSVGGGKTYSGGSSVHRGVITEQGTVFPADPSDLLGDFWPEEESIDEFLAALHEWRGHHKSDRAA